MNTDRNNLLKLLQLLRPAISTQTFIPALQHVQFAEGWATAYNDTLGVSVRCDLLDAQLQQCLPGDLMIRALQSFKADAVALVPREAEVLVQSGRSSKMKLPSLPVGAFPFTMPTPQGAQHLCSVGDSLLAAFGLCLFGVGTDPTHPAQQGVTLEVVDGGVSAYTTDNVTITQVHVPDQQLNSPGGVPVLLPTALCEQLRTLGQAFQAEEIELYQLQGGYLATFGDRASLFCKALLDLDPLDFGAVLDKHITGNTLRQLQPVPDGLEPALARALLVLQGEVDKVTQCSVRAGAVSLLSVGSLGDSEEQVSGPHALIPAQDVKVDPGLVLRALKHAGTWGFLRAGLLVASADCKFLHLISYCSN